MNFISSKDTDKEHTMYSESDNIEVLPYDDANEAIEELFESLLFRYYIGLETQMRGSDFIFDCVNLMHYKCFQVNFKSGGSYIDSPDWIKKKKATKNLKKG